MLCSVYTGGWLNLKDMYESLIVFGVMTGLLLPARLLFITYVSDNWIGSFGIISAISITLLVLVKKGKLGKFGRMFQRQIDKLLSGKRRIIVYAESAFVLALLGTMIFAINMGNSSYSHIQDEFEIAMKFDNSETLIAQTEEWTAEEWFNGFVAMPIAFIVAFPQMSAVIAHIDSSLNGWLMHFYTVGFVEYAEFLGILLLYRFVLKTKPKTEMFQ